MHFKQNDYVEVVNESDRMYGLRGVVVYVHENELYPYVVYFVDMQDINFYDPIELEKVEEN